MVVLLRVGSVGCDYERLKESHGKDHDVPGNGTSRL